MTLRALAILPVALCLSCVGPRPPEPGAPGASPGEFSDERLEFARSVAAKGIPSPTPQLDALSALLATRQVGELRDILSDSSQGGPPLRLRPGDKVVINAASSPEFSGERTLLVDGNVDVMGGVRAAGLTPEQLATRLRTKLIDEYKLQGASVTVTVAEPAPRSARAVGRVRANVAPTGEPLLATTVALPPAEPLGVYGLLAQVQGLASDADDQHIYLMRRRLSAGDGAGEGSRIYRFSYAELLEAHVDGRELWLEPNDQVVVPRLPDVFVTGAVRAPGRYPLRQGFSVTSAVLLAGGFADGADTGGVLLLDTQGSHAASVDDPVTPGQVVFVPAGLRIYVVGAGVRRNGPLALPYTGLSALQAVAEAGWFMPLADRDGVEIQRFRAGRRERIAVPVDAILAGERKDTEFMLQPGDTLVVPEAFW